MTVRVRVRVGVRVTVRVRLRVRVGVRVRVRVGGRVRVRVGVSLLSSPLLTSAAALCLLRSTPTMSDFCTSLAAWSRVSPTRASQISIVWMSCPVALMSSCIARPTWLGLELVSGGVRVGVS